MSRRRKAQIRQVLPDPVYNSLVLSKFINAIMIGGEKSTAEKIIDQAFTSIQSKGTDAAIEVFNKAIEKKTKNICNI